MVFPLHALKTWRNHFIDGFAEQDTGCLDFKFRPGWMAERQAKVWWWLRVFFAVPR